ncbi:MAG: sensor domain-containing diguanylate cyclase [Nitrospirae bacterium]|nr:sensor domain-containing diguanylate cyclase [Nitrospirota bacterium]
MHNNNLINFIDEITKILSTTSDLNKTLTSVMRKIKTFTGAETWSLLITDDLFFKTIALKKSMNIKNFRYETGTGLTGWVLRKGVPILVRNVSKDKRFNKNADGFHKLKVKSLICAPLKVNDGLVGILRLVNKRQENSFSDTDLKLLVNVSHNINMMFKQAFLYKKIDEIAVTDDLTGLYNVRFLNRSIEIEIERSLRYGSLFSLIFLDIDNLKKVNEKFGHLTGSKVLIETARLLQDNLRKVDVTIRYGGDEFVIVLPQTPQEGGFLVAERLRKIIEKNLFLKKEKNPLKITASFGVASFPDNANNKEALLRLADKAMFRGKFSTKNVVFAAK